MRNAMKTLIRIAAPVMAIALLSAAPLFVHAQQQNSATVQDWNTPPAGTEQAQQGYRDGVEAAQLDRAAKRPIDAKVSHLYVHPPVKGAAREAYRNSFAAGYDAAVKHNTPGM
jgi:hypothetical protein